MLAYVEIITFMSTLLKLPTCPKSSNMLITSPMGKVLWLCGGVKASDCIFERGSLLNLTPATNISQIYYFIFKRTVPILHLHMCVQHNALNEKITFLKKH